METEKKVDNVDRKRLIPMVVSWLSLSTAAFGVLLCLDLLTIVLSGDAGSCTQDGCETVLQSAVSKPLGIPLPAYGCAAFLTVLVSLLVKPQKKSYREMVKVMRTVVIVSSCVISGLLIAYATVVLHAKCPWCRTSAIAFAGLGILILAGGKYLDRLRWTGVVASFVCAAIAVGVFDRSMRAGKADNTLIKERSIAALWPEKERVIGDFAKSRVRCLVFVDFTCSTCLEELKELIPFAQQNPILALGIRNRNIHEQTAERMSALSHAAARQGRYWEFVKALASAGSEHSSDDLVRSMNLDSNDDDYEATRKDDRIARTAGIQSTPVLLFWTKGRPAEVGTVRDVKRIVADTLEAG